MLTGASSGVMVAAAGAGLDNGNTCVPEHLRMVAHMAMHRPVHVAIAYGHMALWPYGPMALWPYGTMALWPYGHAHVRHTHKHTKS